MALKYALFTAPVNFRTESGEHIEFNNIPNREELTFDYEVSDALSFLGRYSLRTTVRNKFCIIQDCPVDFSYSSPILQRHYNELKLLYS